MYYAVVWDDRTGQVLNTFRSTVSLQDALTKAHRYRADLFAKEAAT